MKKIRKRYLPEGWYPIDKDECKQEIGNFIEKNKKKNVVSNCKIGGVVPHAGWYFSGEIATLVYMNLEKLKPDLVVVFGGHLASSDEPLIVTDDAWETPLGEIEIDKNIINDLVKKIHFDTDEWGDNTIEVQLPFIKYFFSNSKILPIRLPPSEKAIKVAENLTSLLEEKDVNFISIGSSDLTHYGPNYGFLSHGTGKSALEWVKKNDEELIDLAVNMHHEKVIEHANNNDSACSAGAMAGVVAMAKKFGINKGILLEYKTSYEVMPDDSFVGYAGIVWGQTLNVECRKDTNASNSR
ncbi:MAG: AmmeMemoRadiSam system protein B [Candidatus Firestonebacteria bacterium]